MSQAERNPAKLHELLALLVDGTISDRRRRQLRTILAEDEQARQYYVEFMVLCANLRQYSAGAPAGRTVKGPTEDQQRGHAPKLEAEPAFEQEHRKRIERYAKEQLEAAVAALLEQLK